MTKRYLVLLTLLAVGLPSLALAQPVGPEFQVNTYTTNAQSGPSAASDPSGNFVVVWSSTKQDNGGYYDVGVFGQRYDSGGNRLGDEFHVNTFIKKSQSAPSVASDAAGNFVVVWQSNDGVFEEGHSYGLFGQRYDSGGNRLGGEFKVNNDSYPVLPSVASDASGNFVVVWSLRYRGSIFGQRYDSDGNALGGKFEVNTYTGGAQDRPSVSSDASGNFVVVWDSYPQDGGDWGIFGQRYDSGGNPIGGEFQVNTYTPNYQDSPAVASDASGNFVVVWESSRQDGSDDGVFGQRYDADGNPLGSEFQINTHTPGAQSYPSVASDPTGNFVVTWEGKDDQDGHSWGVFGQQFDSGGQRIGGEFQVNTYTTDDQRRPSVSLNASSDFVVVWDSKGQDRNSYGVFGQRFVGQTDPVRCGDLRAARARCRNGNLELGIALKDVSHDGDTLTLRINGQDQVVAIHGSRAQASAPGQGLNTLLLVSPPNCGPEKTVQCP